MTLQAPSAELADPADRHRIVVVEDDRSFRDIISRSLEMSGFEVTAFEKPEAALRHVAQAQPHVVLTDLCLGETTGLHVLARVKQIDADLPVVVMTAHGDVRTAAQAAMNRL